MDGVTRGFHRGAQLLRQAANLARPLPHRICLCRGDSKAEVHHSICH